MKKPLLKPTVGDGYRIVFNREINGAEWDFEGILSQSQQQEADGDIEGACNTRYEAVQRFMELIPDDQEMTLEWEDETDQNALLMVSCSAIDHFLIGDFEMCAGMLELILELDPEDHLDASKRLAYTYVALEEYELFDEVINDISDKYPDKNLLSMWSEFRQKGSIPEGEFIHFKKTFPAFYKEFTASEHPVSEQYLKEVEGEKPSREVLARELWLQTEHLWILFPGFIEALKAK